MAQKQEVCLLNICGKRPSLYMYPVQVNKRCTVYSFIFIFSVIFFSFSLWLQKQCMFYRSFLTNIFYIYFFNEGNILSYSCVLYTSNSIKMCECSKYTRTKDMGKKQKLASLILKVLTNTFLFQVYVGFIKV